VLDHPVVTAAADLAESVANGRPVPGAPAGAEATIEECVTLAWKLLLAKLEHRHKDAQDLEDDLKFGGCDPGWLDVIVEYEEHFLHGRPIPYVTYRNIDDFVLDVLPDDATVALVGDWGTGTDAARDLLQEIAAYQPDVMVHLGDIYYSGTPREAHARFLDVCNDVLRADGREVLVYTLSGNHDMYSGGEGYYGLLPLLNPSSKGAQPASFFGLRTASGAWQLLAMDTGYHDHDPFTVTTDVTYLEPAEAEWHLDKVRGFGGRTILLSHHQLFSANEYIGEGTQKPAGLEAYNPKLLETFGPVLNDVSAWFWGHEHNLCIYEPYGDLAKGRCLGHGAVPVYESAAPYRVSPHIPKPPGLVASGGKPVELAMDSDRVYGHGYAILELGSGAATYYVQGLRDALYSESLTG
jgi:Calcineurin-like phosphoesterase